MQVNTSSWHYKVYRWWYVLKYGEIHTYFDYNKMDYVTVPAATKSSNLCPYVRAVFLWSWLGYLLKRGKITLGKYWIPVPALTWLLLAIEIPRWLGIISYDAKKIVYIIYAVGVSLAAVFGAGFFVCWLEKEFSWFSRVFGPVGQRLGRVGGSVADGASLLKEYGRAQHDRVCPEITFVSQEVHEV